MSKINITTRQALKISKLIGKLGLKVNNPEGDAKEVGADLILQIIGKLYLAEEEIAEIIEMLTGTPKETALDANVMELFENIDNEIINFFISAVKSRLQE